MDDEDEEARGRWTKYRRSNGTYYADLTRADGERERFSLNTTDEREADRHIDMLNLKHFAYSAKDIGITLEILQKDGSIQVGVTHKKDIMLIYHYQFLKYLSVVKKISKRHMHSYIELQKTLKYYGFSWEFVDDMALLIDMQEKLLAVKARTTVEKQMTLLRAFVNWLYASNHISDSVKNMVLSNIMTENHTRVITPKELMTLTEFNALLEHAFTTDRDFYMFLMLRFILCTRIEECINISVNDIRVRQINVRQQKTERVKSITLPPTLMAYINKYCRDNNLQNNIFIGANKNSKYYYLKFKQALKTIGLNPNYQLDQIRHLSATLVNELFDKHDAALYLGHYSSRDITSRYIVSESTTTLKISTALCYHVEHLRDFTEKPIKKPRTAPKTPQTKKHSI
ncbi:MAG: hypothetical protein ATN35_08590 [Epulopiscium sp. Nele67-Bin004]|nr:MAG: hypothetical protein ATN35_08590 [Epulopiscium sp. Nele67-Bin004]